MIVITPGFTLSMFFTEFPSIVRNKFAQVAFGLKSLPFMVNGTMQKHVIN